MPVTAEPDPLSLLRPRRRIEGCCAVLLPFGPDGSIDWQGFAGLLGRTVAAGLRPAVNMDTGHVHLLSADEREEVLERTADRSAAGFLAGAFVADRPGDAFDLRRHVQAIERIIARGGVPVIFPSHGLATMTEDDWVGAHARFAEHCESFVAFELSPVFHPAGRIASLDGFAGLVAIEACIGAKHSSLRRDLEWRRLALRDRTRPDFRVFTGNDLAIDMVMYGSDYLLGLSSFAPDLFARRDALWHAGHSAFHALNDALQYLGNLAFRAPVPGYRHSAAQFLHLRGWLDHDSAAPAEVERPVSDRELLSEILARLDALDLPGSPSVGSDP
jgi:dihydrodipicolinate synthase/N-acetylneuraminate lyase